MKPGIREKEKVLLKGILRIAAYLAAASVALQAAFYSVAMAQTGGAPPVRMAKIETAPGQALVVVEVYLAGGSVEMISTGTVKYARRERLDVLARRSQALAAINGCYFDMRTGRLVGHVYDRGRREVEGSFGAAFAVMADNRAVIAPLNGLGDPKKYRTIITCVDILMKDGVIHVKSKRDLVRNGHNPSRHNDIYRPARWSAIGIGRSGKVYLVATPNRMSIYRFAQAVKDNTEIVDLLGLDGGSSSGLYYKGSMVVRPARTIPSVIVARAATALPRMLAKR